MSKHTSGPWEIDEDGGIVAKSQAIVIGQVYDSSDYPCLDGNEAEVDAEAAANAKLIAAAPELLRLLGVMFDAYENGTPCYEDPEEFAGPLGNAIKLDDADFHKIADLLNELDPRT